MADFVLTLIQNALLLVPKLSPKLFNIDGGLKVIGYANGRNKASFDCKHNRWREERVVVLTLMLIVKRQAFWMMMRMTQTRKGQLGVCGGRDRTI
jgi:hypothetical protein